MIDDGKTGFICEFGDIESVAKSALELLQNEELHASFVKKCMDAVQTKFQSKTIISQYEEIYCKLLQNK